jgi:hypothetical protein
MACARRVSFVGLLAVLAFTAACGSSGSSGDSGSSGNPAAPSTPSGPTTSTAGLFTFTFDAGTSATEQQLIKDEVQFAQTFIQNTFGRTVSVATAINGSVSAAGCSQGGASAFTAPAAITFCMNNPGWQQPPTTQKRKIVVHEVFHLVQYEMRWLGVPQSAGAMWMIEGSAELVGWRAIANKGLIASDTSLGCMVKEVSDFTSRQPPGLLNLSAYENAQVFQTTQGPLYPLSMLGVNQLTTTSGLNAIMTYGSALVSGTQFPTAFSNAFGSTTAAFYAQWPGYVSGLAVPPTYLCGV